ncbi:MAG: MotB family protein [Rhizobiaceae bacterium]
MSGEEEKQEIIIVKRGGGGGDGHHGGAWKIAFADFMTAMMALFLVLWLVNAANEKTKKSVASYFNPVKLIDRTRSTRGLDESTSADLPKNTEEDEEDGKSEESSSSSQASVNEEDFFKDPFAVLDRIATTEQAKIEASMSIREEIYEAASDQEDAFMDPFAETMPPPKPVDEKAEEQTELAVDQTQPQQTVGQVEGETPPIEEGNALEKMLVPASLKIEPRDSADQEATKLAAAGKADEAAEPQDSEALKKAAAAEKKEATSEEIREEIEKRLAEKLGQGEHITESLSVQVTEDGVLISITDQYGFSMFQVGSAVPKGEVVLAMAEISNVLAEREGKIRVYGHTDGRPYVGDDYDNWRLSTARAHAARLMLSRGGLEETRVSQVVGFSDRVLRRPDDPEADENRRIEILLEVL